MKKILLAVFSFLILTTTFAAPKRYKLLNSTSNWSTAAWSLAGVPGNGDTVTIPVDMQLILASNLTLQDVYFDIYGGLVLASSSVNLTLQNASTVNLHVTGWIGGFFASQNILLGNSSIFTGSQFLLLGARMATNTSNGFVPYVETQILPVTFTSFTVARNSNSYAITWTTAQESNVAYYEVQRSTDGGNWQHIATVSADGNHTNAYRYADRASAARAVYYRIRQVDADGAFTYTAVRMLRNSTGNLPAISAVSNNIRVVFAQPVNDKITIQIIGLNGSVAAMQTVTAPSGALQLTTSGLHGIYIVHVSNGRDLNAAQQVLL